MPPAPQPTPERQPIPGVKNLVAVASGKGGVGKTTVAVNLALALAKLGHRVGLLDADVYGPNVPIMLGATQQPEATQDKRIIPVQSQGLKMISMGLLNPGDKPMIWRGPMLHSVITQFLRSVEWGELDYLIIDLPPGTGDVQLTLIQLTPFHAAQELCNHAVQHRPAPDHGLITGVQQAHGNHLQPLRLDRNDALILRGFRLLCRAQHDRYVGPVNVRVEQADSVAELRQGQCQVYGDGGLADAAFAAGNGDEILHAGDRLTFRCWLRCWRHVVLFSWMRQTLAPWHFLYFFPDPQGH